MRLPLVLSITLLLSALAVAGPASAAPPDPIGQDCVGRPGVAGACVTSSPSATCVSAGVGLQGAYVCSSPSYGLRVCTSMDTALYGYCPTNLLGG